MRAAPGSTRRTERAEGSGKIACFPAHATIFSVRLVLSLLMLLQLPAPHLRNDVDGHLRRFKNVVARQARAFPQSFFLEGQSEDKAIALTFDDGPDPIYTDQILGILDKNDV